LGAHKPPSGLGRTSLRSGEGESEAVENLATVHETSGRNDNMGTAILIIVFVVLLLALFMVRGRGRRRA
jgi:heme/copper-type cytochrome/quinol oxidase subunit 2